MKIEYKSVWVAAALGFAVGAIDTVMDYLVFYRGMGFLDLTFKNVPIHEIWMRGLILTSFTIFGIFIGRYIARIKETEGRYHQLFDNVNDMIFVRPFSNDGLVHNFSDVNVLACKKLGYTREELLHLTVLDIIDSTRRHEIPALMKLLAKEKNIIFEITLIGKDGRMVPVEFSSHLYEGHGTQTVFCTVRDLSTRLEAEEEKSRLASFPELTPYPILEVDGLGAITYANLASKETLKKLSLMGPEAFLPPDLDEIINNARRVGINQYYREVNIGGALFAEYIYYVPRFDVARILPIEITAQRRTEDALRESELQLRFLTSQLLNIQENERKRIAAELHDELGQALLVVKLKLSAIHDGLPKSKPKLQEDASSLLEYLDQLIEKVRTLLLGLNFAVMEELGLSNAMKFLLEEMAQHYHLKGFHLQADDIDNLFPPQAQLHIYRIFQEIIANICKHARATSIIGEIVKQDDKVQITIQDDGQGFDRETMAAGGIGLATIEERVRMLGGTMEFSSHAGAGTRVALTIPIKPKHRPVVVHNHSSKYLN